MNKYKAKLPKFVMFQLILIIILLTGEIMCIGKAIRCNWEPIGKAEVIYTASAITGLGGIVGYLKIDDN